MITIVGLAGCAGTVSARSAATLPPDLQDSTVSPDPLDVSEEEEQLVSAEGKGDRLLAEGRPYQALRAYLAALAAEKSGSRNSQERISGILEKCRWIVDRIRIEPLTAGMTVQMGRPFPAPLRAKVVFNGQKGGLSGVRLLVRHKIPGGGVSGGESVLRFVSDGTGTVSYKPSVPFFEGNGAVYISLDLDEYLAEIADHSYPDSDAAEALRALERSINGVQAVFPYRVEAAEDRVVLGVLISDRDNAGKATGGAYTASGIAGVFDSSIFDVKILDAGSVDREGSYREIARRFGDLHGRSGWLVYGNARISEYEERGGRVYITVTGSARVMHLASDEPVYATGEMKKSVIGGNSRSTVLSAYRQLGKILGAELINHLE